MRCFELNDTRVMEGLRVDVDDEKIPHVKVTANGELFFTVDPSLKDLILRAYEEEERPIRLRQATFTPNFDLAPTDKTEEALVRLDLRSPQGGLISLSAANDRGEVLNGNRVVKSFGPFPPMGVDVLGLPGKTKIWSEQPWNQGTRNLELVITMKPGSSFRISRTRVQPGVTYTTFVSWSGKVLDMAKVRGRNPMFATLGEVARLS